MTFLPPEEQERIDLAVENTDLYWLSVIAQLGHMQAATAETAGMLSRTSRSEKARQTKICETYIHVLQTRQIKDRRHSPESAIERLAAAIDELSDKQVEK